MGRVSPSKQNTYGQRPVVPEIPKVEIPRQGGRSAHKRAEREAAVKRSQTPYVPPAPKPSTGKRKGGVARPTGGIQIGLPQSSPISTKRRNRSSSTTTENPTRPVQATGGAVVPAFSYYDQARKANPDGGTRNFGEGYKEKELAAGQAAENSRAGAGFGSETRVSPTNVVQTGINTSPKPMTMDEANKLLTGGYTMNQQYASNQLPTTASSPYAGKGNAQIYNPDTLHQHNSDVDYVSLSKNLDEDKSGVELATRNGAMKTDYKQMDVNPGEKAPEEKINWANRTMADNSDSKLARRRAFLDAKGSMQGLRRSEAVQGMTYAGGKHYIADGKGGDNLIEMGNKDDVRTYKSGEEGARAMRDKYVNALTSKDNSVDYQTDAPTPLPDAVPHNTSMDNNPHDTKDLLNMNPGKSIIGNNTPYTSVNRGTLLR
jgi:hypothetical protein